MSVPLVSVIVPAYKHERYILECLRSVGDQTHPRLELIFVDDHSPDATFALAEALLRTAYSKRFERVVLHRKDANQGAHDSLNYGIAQSQGDYIAIINSDDKFRPKRLELLIEATAAANTEFGFTGVDTFTDSAPSKRASGAGRIRFPESLIMLRLQQKLNIARDASIGYALLRQNVAISTGNFFFSRRLANEIGGFLPLQYCHDWDFILQALIRTEPTFVDEPLYEYRLHPNNTFWALRHLAEVETEVVLRRFFKAIVLGEVSNPRCPSPGNDPGLFEAFLSHAKYEQHWAKESGLPLRGERVRDPSAARPLETLTGFADILDSV